MREHDWSTSPLGPPDAWSQSLRTTLALVLGAQAQIVLFWGPEFCALYNDAYAPTIGDKHPHALGRPGAEHWSELWPDLHPLLADVRETGETFAAKDRPFYIERRGGRGETVYFDVSYSAVPDDDGSVGGVLCIVSETTERVLAQRRQAYLLAADAALRDAPDAIAAMREAARLLAQHLGASRCAYANVLADSNRFTIREDYVAPGMASSAGDYSLDLFGTRAAADMREGRTLVIRDVGAELEVDDGRDMFGAIGIAAIVCCPLVKNGRLVAMMAVHQDSPRDWRDNEIELVQATVERCWAHVERVGAEARLRASEERYRALFNTIDEAIMVIERAPLRPDGLRDYHYVSLNPAALSMFGIADLTGQSVRDNFPDEDEEWYDIYDRVADTGESLRLERESLPQDMVLEAFVSRISSDPAQRLMVVMHDVTAQRRALGALRASEQRYRTLFENIDEGFCIIEFTDGHMVR